MVNPKTFFIKTIGDTKMENLKEDVLLKFHPNTLQMVRKEFGLDDSKVLNNLIDELEIWISEQKHFTKRDYSRDFLERFIIICKGSMEKCKLKMDKTCTIRNLLSRYFENLDARLDVAPYDNLIHCALLPKLSKRQERVFILRNNNYTGQTGLFESFRFMVKILDYVKAKDYNLGLIAIIDYSNLNMKRFLSKLDLVEVREILSVISACYGLRISRLYLISSSSMVNGLVQILKQMLPAKIFKRFKVLKTYEGLLSEVPKEILPEEYEGPEKCIDDLHEDLVKELTTASFMEHLRDMRGAKTDENYRDSKKFNDSYLGTPGVLKHVIVD